MKEKSKKIKVFRWTIFIATVAIFIYSIIYLFPIMKNIITPEGRAIFKEKITNTGLQGALLLFGLEFAQVFFVVLPGEPLEILAGMCYGSFWGTVYLLISVFIITTFIFYLVKKFGRKLIYEFCDKKKIEKIEKSKLFHNPKKIELILFVLFFIPGTPKDLLVYLGGLLPIKPIKFILISTFARLPSIVSSTIAGSNIVAGKWSNIAIAYIVTFLIVLIVFFIINLFDKNKETQKVLKEIK